MRAGTKQSCGAVPDLTRTAIDLGTTPNCEWKTATFVVQLPVDGAKQLGVRSNP